MPTPQIKVTGLLQEFERLGLADYREAARLLQIGGNLGEELAVGEADGDGNPDLLFDTAGKAGEGARGGIVVQPLGAAELQEGLIDGERLHQRCQLLHQRADLAADANVFFHVGLDHDRLRAGRKRLEHRHCRAHAVNAGDVTSRRDDAALAAADNHWLVGKLRIVPLLDGGVKRIAQSIWARVRS